MKMQLKKQKIQVYIQEKNYIKIINSKISSYQNLIGGKMLSHKQIYRLKINQKINKP